MVQFGALTVWTTRNRNVCVCVCVCVCKRHIRFCAIVYYNIYYVLRLADLLFIIYKCKRARLNAFLPKTSYIISLPGIEIHFFLCFARHFSALKYLQQACYKNIHTHIVLYCRHICWNRSSPVYNIIFCIYIYINIPKRVGNT